MRSGVSMPDEATTHALTSSVSTIDISTLDVLTLDVLTLDGSTSTPDVVAPTLVAVAASTAALLAYRASAVAGVCKWSRAHVSARSRDSLVVISIPSPPMRE